MEEFFYNTLPQDTQDFTQVLRGVRRSLGDVARGVSYYPYDLIGAPVDIINMALTPMGLGSQQPVMGSDYLRNIGKSLGLAQDPTGSIPETVSRIGAGFINPAAGARAVGQIPQAVTRGANVSADRLVQMITQNPRATAMGVIDETSMPFMQAMAPKPPGLMEPVKSDIGFYSQLEAATIPLQNKGTGDQYLAQIQKSAGVKPEEIQWTGLDEFLKGKKSVTKQEIQDYLNANRVDVREVRLLGSAPLTEQAFNERFARRGFSMVQTADGPRFRKTDMTGSRQLTYGELPEDIQATIERQSVPQTKHHLGSYQGIKTEIPGGENYREILLTLPFKEPKMPKGYEVSSMQYDDGTIRYFAETPTTRSAGYKTEAEAQSELQRMTEGLKDWRASQASYRSTHFDQPNILAHMRVNDRVVDGKKTLFIEEIQSDWHQAGRKKGYGPQTETTVEAYYTADSGRRISLGFGKTQEEAAAAVDPGWKGLVDVKFDTQTKKVGEGVPDAPFKTSWHELTLKRAIQEASEKGYDQIAFTTGKTQAERYDLSKQIGQITARPTPNGKVALEALTPDMGEQVISKVVNVDELDDIVGKEISDKIRTQIKFPKNFDDRGKSVELSGLNLQVGGEGMAGFYDQILPKSLEKLGKKFDAKVGKTTMKAGQDVTEPGIVAPGVNMEFAGKTTKAPEVEVWVMDITPKMRESVTTKGQPLFAVPAAGLLGAGMYQDEQMY